MVIYYNYVYYHKYIPTCVYVYSYMYVHYHTLTGFYCPDLLVIRNYIHTYIHTYTGVDACIRRILKISYILLLYTESSEKTMFKNQHYEVYKLTFMIYWLMLMKPICDHLTGADPNFWRGVSKYEHSYNFQYMY